MSTAPITDPTLAPLGGGTPPPLALEVGKTYVDGVERLVSIVRFYEGAGQFCSSEGRYYTPSGKFAGHQNDPDYPSHLVREHVEPAKAEPTPPAHAVMTTEAFTLAAADLLYIYVGQLRGAKTDAEREVMASRIASVATCAEVLAADMSPSTVAEWANNIAKHFRADHAQHVAHACLRAFAEHHNQRWAAKEAARLVRRRHVIGYAAIIRNDDGSIRDAKGADSLQTLMLMSITDADTLYRVWSDETFERLPDDWTEQDEDDWLDATYGIAKEGGPQ